MDDIFGRLIAFIPGDRVCIDDIVFRWHHKASGVLLFACSLIVAAIRYVGYPIDCCTEDIPTQVMEPYCLTKGTFIISQKHTNEDFIQTNYVPGLTDITVQSYYQWMPFILVFVGLCFKAPRYLWLYWEGGRMDTIVSFMNSPIYDEGEKNEWKKIRVDYFYSNQKRLNFYAYRYFFCEFLNLVNVLAQMYLMDSLLGGVFKTYGWEVYSFSSENEFDRVDPMALIFPKLTKCTFRGVGHSGTVIISDALCILSINAVNEKIVLVLWIWYIVLGLSTVITLLTRVPLFFSKRIRAFTLQMLMYNSHRIEAREIMYASSIGDWFMLSQVGKNVGPRIFQELIVDLHAKTYHTA
ncbi:innexin inx2-like [Homalodisca vitripennis]|uniref:innexin inx2-like n=1 Tax=Homalodisca vitripennis TaxID=197043 RepID=UPI001EEC8A95|nr:innexin inx2-like [Homalodisca vitripennis]KAG8308151.1 Structural component of gap junctions protein [Homalodisca vitripennis]